MFWIQKGPSLGALYLTSDGKTYWEFCNIKFQYHKLHYIKPFDIYYPTEIELKGTCDDKTLHLTFQSIVDPYEYISRYDNDKWYKAFVLIEMPGKMHGTYTDATQTIPLNGDCKLVPLRQPSVLGHNKITFDFIKPPHGIGYHAHLTSHLLKKEITSQLKFTPRPSMKFYTKRIRTFK